MKRVYIFMAFVTLMLSSCNDNWAEYLAGSSNSEQELSKTITEFLDESTEYSDFYNMLKATGLDKEFTKDQQITVWVVKNDAMARSGIAANDTLRMK